MTIEQQQRWFLGGCMHFAGVGYFVVFGEGDLAEGKVE